MLINETLIFISFFLQRSSSSWQYSQRNHEYSSHIVKLPLWSAKIYNFSDTQDIFCNFNNWRKIMALCTVSSNLQVYSHIYKACLNVNTLLTHKQLQNFCSLTSYHTIFNKSLGNAVLICFKVQSDENKYNGKILTNKYVKT